MSRVSSGVTIASTNPRAAAYRASSCCSKSLAHRGHRLVLRADSTGCPAACGLVDRRTVHGHHGRLAFHHCHATGRPGQDEVRVESLARHRVVSGAGGMVDSQDELRHHRRGHCLDEMCAGANDAFVFCFGADHESADILDEKMGSRSRLAVSMKYATFSALSA